MAMLWLCGLKLDFRTVGHVQVSCVLILAVRPTPLVHMSALSLAVTKLQPDIHSQRPACVTRTQSTHNAVQSV